MLTINSEALIKEVIKWVGRMSGNAGIQPDRIRFSQGPNAETNVLNLNFITRNEIKIALDNPFGLLKVKIDKDNGIKYIQDLDGLFGTPQALYQSTGKYFDEDLNLLQRRLEIMVTGYNRYLNKKGVHFGDRCNLGLVRLETTSKLIPERHRFFEQKTKALAYYSRFLDALFSMEDKKHRDVRFFVDHNGIFDTPGTLYGIGPDGIFTVPYTYK